MFLLVTIIGLCIGSFLNVVIYRIPKEEAIVYPPSHCTNCGYNLRIIDLIPIVSYLSLGGRCRLCRQKISIQYTLIELLNAIMYLLLFFKFNISIEFLFYAILSSCLIVISIIDIKTKDVYSSISIVTLIVAVGYLFSGKYFRDISIINNLLGGVIGYALIFILAYFGAMGDGDTDLAGLCGLFVGIKGILVALFISVIIGGIVASYKLFIKKQRKAEMAFTPCIAAGTIICILIGQELLSAKLSVFL
ncbi:MAG: prepilin peptidase [Clostridium sp.]|nr:prepilin peptidase [Clostridium sp.]